MKDLPLNGKSRKTVTVIHCRETHSNGQQWQYGWVTDLPVSLKNVKEIVKVDTLDGRLKTKHLIC